MMLPRESFLALIAAVMPISTISANFPSFEFPQGQVDGAYMWGDRGLEASPPIIYFNLPLSNDCFTQQQYRELAQRGKFFTYLVYEIREGNEACQAYWTKHLPNLDSANFVKLVER